MSRDSRGKNIRYNSPSFSPSNAHNSYYKSSQIDPEAKLSQKIHRLKHALKAAEQHNEELHGKVKYYKDLYTHEVAQVKEELKRYKKKYGTLQVQHDRKVQQIQQMRFKTDYQQRQAISSAREKVGKIRDMEAKLIQIQSLNLELNGKLNQKVQRIKTLEELIQKGKKESEDEFSRKLTKLEKDLAQKSKQCYQFSKQSSTLKDQLKQATRKLQKTNLTVYQQAERNKQTIEQYKESKKSATLYQKQLNILRETYQKDRMELKQKISLYEKSMLEHEFQKQRLTQKLNDQIQKNQKMHSEIEQLFASYNDLHSKYDEIVASQFEIHKDFQRDLSTIAKELARRHIASKSSKASTAQSVYSLSLSKKELPHFTHD